MRESYKEQYLIDVDFKHMYSKLIHDSRCSGETNYFMKNEFLYKGNALCMHEGERVQLI